jgi:hypothetical protein
MMEGWKVRLLLKENGFMCEVGDKTQTSKNAERIISKLLSRGESRFGITVAKLEKRRNNAFKLSRSMRQLTLNVFHGLRHTISVILY